MYIRMPKLFNSRKQSMEICKTRLCFAKILFGDVICSPYMTKGVHTMIGQLTSTEEINIPGNVRQIGQIQDGYRIYMEDYVSTLLNRISNNTRENSRSIMLFGTIKERNGARYYFIRGAACSLGQYDVMRENCMNDEEREHFDRVREEYFLDQQILGWGIVKGELGRLTQEYIEDNILKSVDWEGLLFLEMDRFNCVDRFYICGEPARRACTGYYIYYERNDAMRRMLSEWKTEESTVPANADVDKPKEWATGQFRSALNKSSEQNDKKSSGTYAFGMVAIIAVLVMAIVSINNYERLNGMEKTIDQVALFIDDKIQAAGESLHAKANSEAEDLPLNEEIGFRIDELQNNELQNDESQNDESATAISVAGDDISASDGDSSASDGDDSASAGVQIGSSNLPTTVDGGDLNQGVETADATPQSGTQSENVDLSDVPTDGNVETEVATEQVVNEQNEDPSGADSETTGKVRLPVQYEICPGDTLVDISRRFYGDENHVKLICDYNNISNSNKIIVGQKILLP